MKYILSDRYRFRGWKKAPYGLFDNERKETRFLRKDAYIMLMKCDGAHDIDIEKLSSEEAEFFRMMEKDKVIRQASFIDFLTPEQEYKTYPARYKESAHWSITGACNLKCRHCFMSAPDAKHGVPDTKQLMYIVDQLADCGVFQVGLTGGEPLIRADFLDLVDALTEKEIGINVIYTNGYLVNEQLLDELERRTGGRKIPFQLSFDGIGWHDFLRGIPGAEEKTMQALRLLHERDYLVNVSMCVHKDSLQSVRETIKLMGSLGVSGVKINTMMDLGEWMNPELRSLKLEEEELLSFYEQYIPQYFQDGAPVPLTLGGMFSYSPGSPKWRSGFVNPCNMEQGDDFPSCASLVNHFYIGAEGMVAPCMGMGDCENAALFPNLFKTPLSEILGESEFMDLCNATVNDVRRHNLKCEGCRYIDRCTGGCRNSALIDHDDYYGIDEDVCWFFHHNGEERIRAAADPAFEEYLSKRQITPSV